MDVVEGIPNYFPLWKLEFCLVMVTITQKTTAPSLVRFHIKVVHVRDANNPKYKDMYSTPMHVLGLCIALEKDGCG